jgi:ATP-grasp domain, R2K clade family 3
MPGDPLRPRQVDSHFEPEAAAARHLGVGIAILDHDALTRGEVDVRALGAGEDLVYRGWMLRPAHYAVLRDALAARGAWLRTTPEAYRCAHEFPGWYPALAGLTPASEWTTGSGRADFDAARERLGPGPAVLRDWTKSMKHYWTEAAFVSEAADAQAAWRVACRFLELREDDFAGGLVLRRYELWGAPELRSWWVSGRCALVGDHPDTPCGADVGDLALHRALDLVAPVVGDLGLPFVTVDLARREDGVWRVVELGDGQVSDRPTTLDPGTLVAALVQGATP